jgi:hypothetical protein
LVRKYAEWFVGTHVSDPEPVLLDQGDACGGRQAGEASASKLIEQLDRRSIQLDVVAAPLLHALLDMLAEQCAFAREQARAATDERLGEGEEIVELRARERRRYRSRAAGGGTGIEPERRQGAEDQPSTGKAQG